MRRTGIERSPSGGGFNCFVRLLTICVGLVFPLSGQVNLVGDGHFELPKLGWTVIKGNSYYGHILGRIDVNGDGSRSRAFIVWPGTIPEAIEQRIPVAAGSRYCVRLDAMAETMTSLRADAGNVRILADSLELAVHDFGFVARAGLWRARMSGAYVARKTGSVTLRIEFGRRAVAVFGIRQAIDNVWLEESDGPLVRFDGQSKAGNQGFRLELLGEPGARTALFLGARKMAGVRIPGFSGFWELHQPTELIFLGRLGASGTVVVKAPLPLWAYRLRGELQAIQASAKGTHLGIRYPIVVY